MNNLFYDNEWPLDSLESLAQVWDEYQLIDLSNKIVSLSSSILMPTLDDDNDEFELRDYQYEGMAFLKSRKRAMLLDAPGLGKTAQATFAAEEPVLVLCPAYLVPQWQVWLNSQHFEGVEAAIGYREERNAILDKHSNWLIANIEMLDTYHQFKDKIWMRRWRTIIIDESHHLKSHIGKRARVAVELCKNAEFVFMLTATPVKREIDDFFMQLRILQPEIFTSYWRFVKTFCRTEDTYFGTKILGAKKSMLKEFRHILDVVSLGRDYETAGRELPPIIEKKLYVVLNPEVRKIYNELIDYWRIRDAEGNLTLTNYMEALHTLRQHLTGSLKTDSIKDLIEDDGRKSVIFSWYKNTATAIKIRIGSSCELITGDLDIHSRREVALNSKIVSATIGSLSEGIDLSAARNVVFAETDWTPGSNYQALSRVRRERIDGDNSEPVIATYVVCKNTIDEAILDVSNRRAGTVKEVVQNALYL